MITSKLLTESKLKSPQELAGVIKAHQDKGQKVAHAHGVFDVVHPGHIRHLSAARSEGDVLVVSITADRFVNKGPDRPVFKERLRAEFLASLALVDYVVINEAPTAVDLIAVLKPNVYVKGRDYQVSSEDITGGIDKEAAAIQAVGGKIVFTDDITYSSSQLINSNFSVLTGSAEEHLRNLRTSISTSQALAALDAVAKLNILVIGDVIIDEYCFCRVLGRSSKATSLNAQYLSEESHAGGILAIANHLSAFCKSQTIVTALGDKDSRRDFIDARLAKHVELKTFSRGTNPTTVKRRFIEPFMVGKLFELSFVSNEYLSAVESAKLTEFVDKNIAQFDVVVVADFGHGLIDRALIELVCSKSKFLALNVQTNSANFGFNLVTKYPRTDYLSIDENELRLTYQDQFSPLEDLIRRVAGDLRVKIVAITQGVKGSTIYSTSTKTSVQTPIFSKEVVDTTGAGDAFLAVTAPLAALGNTPELIGLIGNSVGAMAVKVLGNKQAIEKIALQKYLKALLA